MDERYDPKKIEPFWQAEWDRTNLYLTREDPGRPKFYILEMFPYPSGAGLSVGHLHNYVPCDVVGRYKRMAGFNVLHPMGWDAFGLPAENEAVLKGSHPTETVPRYAANFKRQLTISGCAYDWSREINSSSPEYYKWTQWFFLMLLKRGLAYRATGAQWWCDKCGTVLANEQVINGCCWRHTDNPVTKKDLEQWYIKITDYADRLLADLDGIDWPEPIKLMQRNWIGRSEGAELAFPVTGHADKEVRFFTTRPDTVFGVSFMVLAPEHPLVAEITTPEHRAMVESYAADARRQTEIERMSTAKEKSGVFTGAYAHNVFTDKDIPIWIADYVLMGYGTGAIMAAPGEDQRDFEFATKYGLEIPRVTAPADGTAPPADRAFSDHGIAINSGFLNGKTTPEAITAVCQYAEKNGIGRATINYRMRDWLISRQRYWGCPIPIVYCKTDGIVPVPEDQLPVLLPPMKDYLPPGTGRSPLANVPEFVNTTCPKCGGPAERETDTLDGFACSSWYFLRFASPHEDARPFDRRACRLLAAGRSLRRRRRARRDASAVRADVDQGDVRRGADRLRRTVPQFAQPGRGMGKRRPADVEKQRQRRHARRDDRKVRRRRASALGAVHEPLRRSDQLERRRHRRHAKIHPARLDDDAPLHRVRLPDRHLRAKKPKSAPTKQSS